jgi:hypothetical protein
MQAIDACRRRGERIANEVPGIAERVGKEGRLYHAAQAGAQPSEGAIDIAVVLPLEVLQDFLPDRGALRINDSISFAMASSVMDDTPAGGSPNSNGVDRWKSDCTHFSPHGMVQSKPILEIVAGESSLAIIGSTVMVFMQGIITVSRIGSKRNASAHVTWLSSQRSTSPSKT